VILRVGIGGSILQDYMSFPRDLVNRVMAITFIKILRAGYYECPLQDQDFFLRTYVAVLFFHVWYDKRPKVICDSFTYVPLIFFNEARR